jgi:hypothetical protein
MKEFIEKNIGYSVLAELSENKVLLNHVRERIDLYTVPIKNRAITNEFTNNQL